MIKNKNKNKNQKYLVKIPKLKLCFLAFKK